MFGCIGKLQDRNISHKSRPALNAETKFFGGHPSNFNVFLREPANKIGFVNKKHPASLTFALK